MLLIVFVLACNAVTQPFRDAKEAVGTVQSIASAQPFETLQAIATALPLETLQSVVTMPVETLEAVPSVLPDFGDMFNPQGKPASEWKGVPIMPQATAGQEIDANNYSFKFTGTVKEAQDFYGDALGKLGWSSTVSMPGDANGAVMVFQKDNSFLTITVVYSDAAHSRSLFFHTPGNFCQSPSSKK
jgi:hypothetical protein